MTGGVEREGQQFTIESSFVADMPEVLSMRASLRQRDKAFVFPYELLQNALDYHAYSDNVTDLPSVVFILPDGQHILHSEMDDNTPNPVRIEFHNTIRGAEGLDPYEIADIVHRVTSPTLGKHGRGGTVAAAAALTDQHIASIDYRSKARNAQGGVYSWRGKGIMKITNPVHQIAPRFILEVEYLPEDISETVVGIDNPDQTIVDALKSVPAFFLPANPRYEGYKLKGSEEIAKIPNLMTIYLGGSLPGQTFTEEELEEIFYLGLPEFREGALPKVEILPDELIGRSSSNTLVEYVYEGGLRLNAYGWRSKYALNWSFYGFGGTNAQYGYNPSRSRDSTHIDGSAANLIAVTLKHCENPEIFFKILRNCVEVKRDDICVEAQIDPMLFTNLPAKTETALLEAWRRIAQERGFTLDTLITQDEGIKRRLGSEGKRAVYVASASFTQVLTKALNLQDATEVLGIKEEIKETGEHMRYTRGNLEEHRSRAVSSLMKFMSDANGSINLGQGRVTAQLARAIGSNFHRRYTDMPIALRTFVEDYLSAGGSLRLNIADTVFEIEMKGAVREGVEAAMVIKKGTILANNGKLMVEILAANDTARQTRDQFLAELDQKLGEYIKADGTLDWEAYRAASADALEDLERQIADGRRRLRETALAQIERGDGFAPRLSAHARSVLAWSNIARLASVAALLGALTLGTGKLLTELSNRGVAIPGIELSTNVIDIAGFKTILPIRESVMQSVEGILMPRFEDRLPDRISPAEAAILQPLIFADILHVPKSLFKGFDGEAIGYFPLEQFVHGKPLALQKQSAISFDRVFIVNSLDQAPMVIESDDILVYKPRLRYQSLYPPVGWEIVSIYQVGGKKPVMNRSKALFWENSRDVPSEVVVMARKINEEPVAGSRRVRSYGAISPFNEYDPQFDITKAMNLNDRLKNDPQLQALHKSFLQEMILWQISEAKDRRQAAEIALKYLNRFAEYSDTRGYGLTFQINKRGTGFDSIVSIADDPQAKYFCSVASNVTKELLESMGIMVANQPGNTLYNVKGILYAAEAHQNNVVYLPDGRLLVADNNPFLKDEDRVVSSQQRPSITSATGIMANQQIERIEKLRANLQRSKGQSYLPTQTASPSKITEQVQTWDGLSKMAVEIGVPLAAAALAFFALKKIVPTLRQSEIRRRIEKSVKENGLSNIEFRLVSAIEGRLANGSEQDEQSFAALAQQCLDLMVRFNLREHGPALEWFAERPQGIAAVTQGEGILSVEQAFAKVSSDYLDQKTEVADRFPPSLRKAFLSTESNVPDEFRLLYTLAVLIHTQSQGSATSLRRKADIINEVIRKGLAEGQIGPSKIRMVDAMYQQLTGRHLKEALSVEQEQNT